MLLLQQVELMPLDAFARKVAKEESVEIIDAIINGALVRLADGDLAQWGRHGYSDIQRIKTAAQRRLDALIRNKNRTLNKQYERLLTQAPRREHGQEAKNTATRPIGQVAEVRRVRRVRRADTDGLPGSGVNGDAGNED